MTGSKKTLSELAQLVGGQVLGNDRVEIERVAPIEEAGLGDITFLAHPRYRRYLATSKASAVIVGRDLAVDAAMASQRSLLQVSDPYRALANILQLFQIVPNYNKRVSPRASVEPQAVLEDDVTVFPHVYVSAGARVRRGTVLFPGVFLGEGVEIGEDCVLHAQVVVREGCRLGDRVVLHPGVVVGSDGFGYAGHGKERIKIPQVGTVVIEDDVEIGANTTVDRATLGRTVIGRGSKIDNLVQIAHNVVVGEHSVIAAQAGIAGSTRIGKEVVLAGQVGIVNHVEIGDRAVIGPQSGIPQSVPPGAVLSGGIAAAPHRQWLKVIKLLPQLPELWNAMRQLEGKLSRLAKKGVKGAKVHARRQRDS